MSSIYKKIALGLAFSPRVEALLAECARLKNQWESELVLIHVGEHGAQEEEKLEQLLAKVNLTLQDVNVFWERGKPADRILETCKKQNVDLLVAGALKKENLIQYYLGTTARTILRKANCSVLMLVNPSAKPNSLENIVVNVDDGTHVKTALKIACEMASHHANATLHAVRDAKFGLTMSTVEEYSEAEYADKRQRLVRDEIEKIHTLLKEIPKEKLKLNIELLYGRSGYELSQFAVKKKADLLVVGASPKKFSLFDRVFSHDLEYIFADLPCNLLIVHPRKEAKRG